MKVSGGNLPAVAVASAELLTTDGKLVGAFSAAASIMVDGVVTGIALPSSATLGAIFQFCNQPPVLKHPISPIKSTGTKSMPANKEKDSETVNAVAVSSSVVDVDVVSWCCSYG